jgi:hypothetical protein
MPKLTEITTYDDVMRSFSWDSLWALFDGDRDCMMVCVSIRSQAALLPGSYGGAALRTAQYLALVCIFHQLTVLELHDPIAEVVVAVVVADHHDRFVAGPEVWQQALIEDLAIVWILVRRPLIEHVNRPVLKECGEER